MHVWSAPASRRMFAVHCLTTYYYVRGLHAESFRAFLSFSSSSHFTDAAVELRALPLPGGFAAFFAHLGEVVCAILRHVGRAALSSDGAVVFTATFFFKRCSSLFSDTSIIIFAILIADCASPPNLHAVGPCDRLQACLMLSQSILKSSATVNEPGKH